MKRLVLHIYIMFMALTAMACPSNEVKLVQDWDKTFPKSEKVNHERVTFKTQYGFTLAADSRTKRSLWLAAWLTHCRRMHRSL